MHVPAVSDARGDFVHRGTRPTDSRTVAAQFQYVRSSARVFRIRTQAHRGVLAVKLMGNIDLALRLVVSELSLFRRNRRGCSVRSLGDEVRCMERLCCPWAASPVVVIAAADAFSEFCPFMEPVAFVSPAGRRQTASLMTVFESKRKQVALRISAVPSRGAFVMHVTTECSAFTAHTHLNFV